VDSIPSKRHYPRTLPRSLLQGKCGCGFGSGGASCASGKHPSPTGLAASMWARCASLMNNSDGALSRCLPFRPSLPSLADSAMRAKCARRSASQIRRVTLWGSQLFTFSLWPVEMTLFALNVCAGGAPRGTVRERLVDVLNGPVVHSSTARPCRRGTRNKDSGVAPSFSALSLIEGTLRRTFQGVLHVGAIEEEERARGSSIAGRQPGSFASPRD
jgi:hypothetical protein